MEYTIEKDNRTERRKITFFILVFFTNTLYARLKIDNIYKYVVIFFYSKLTGNQRP